MPPYANQSANMHSQGTPHGNTGGDDATARIRHNEERMRMENRIRILKNAMIEKQRIVHDLDRDIVAIDNELHHIDEDEKRISDEMKQMTQEVRQGEAEFRSSEAGFREKDQELHRKEDETRRYEHEIGLLRIQIEEKERAMAEIKQETSKLMKEKEDYRRAHELGHFTIKSENEHVHERQVRMQLLIQAKQRKENEKIHKEEMRAETKREMNDKSQDILQLETELQRFNSSFS